MAFNNLMPAYGPILLGPYGSTPLTVWFGDPGDDLGALWIMAHPITGPALLEVSQQGKLVDYEDLDGVTECNGDCHPVPDYSKPFYRYTVVVTNKGNQAVFFSVQGGGNT